MLIFFPQNPIFGVQGEYNVVSGIPNISIAYTLPHSGRLSLPVESSSLVYSHFKHVSGIAAPEGTDGITINKLHLLDVLIGQLDQFNRGGIPLNLTEGPDASSLDALIDSYRGQVAQINAESTVMPYTPSPGPAPGTLFNLSI